MRRLTIRNIGPISKADIEITPWVVIVGGNASGKTIISTIHYLTLFQSTPPMPWRINLGTIKAGGVQEASISVKELIEENRELFKQLLTNEIRRLFNTDQHGLVKIGEDEGRIGGVITDSLVLNVIINRRSNTVDFDVNGDKRLNVIIEYAMSNFTQCISSGIIEDGQYRVSVMGSNADCAAHIIVLRPEPGIWRYMVPPSRLPSHREDRHLHPTPKHYEANPNSGTSDHKQTIINGLPKVDRARRV
ncbi:hypothetical protein [Vulcanisaeta distributa]|uniref:ATP-binding protein n=1 Tax=Vulcanisaeta distributa TaxID=164451 RepID=UPI0006CF5B28|nr:hypothetical protein [Vulcanisaeta distributa]